VHTLRLTQGQWTLQDGSLEVNAGLPLHPNHKALYEVLAALSPASVLEAGCGGGDHLHNLSLLLPTAEIRGIDRSEGQLDVLRHRNPRFASECFVVDLTLPHPATVGKADVVFAQAVLMHIQTGNGHRVALWNMFDLAEKQVVLMENLMRHELIRDIQQLTRARIMPWERVIIYRSRHTNGPQLIVASREPISVDLDEVFST
jgi:trans-aconitate methyltransferase